MASLAYREEHRKKLREMQDRLSQIQSSLPVLPDLETGDPSLNKQDILEGIEELSKKIAQRMSRVKSETCRIAVIGLEKQGKSSFVNAWIGAQALPSDTKRCTWASSTIVNSGDYRADIKFTKEADFQNTIHKLYNYLKLSRDKIGFPLPPNIREREEVGAALRDPGFEDLENISRFWNEIRPLLDKDPLALPSQSSAEALNEKLFQYISLRTKDDKEQGAAYAVEHVNIFMKLAEENQLFAIDDLPGIDAPGDRAENMTWKAVEDYADVIVLVKSAFNNATLNRDEINIWNRASQSDSAVKLTERLFVILNQADATKKEHNRDCHLEAFNQFIGRGVPKERLFFCSSRAEMYDALGEGKTSFPYTQEEYQEAVQKISDYRGQPKSTTGFPEFKDQLYEFLRADFPEMEERALRKLETQYQEKVEGVRKLINAYTDSASSENTLSEKEAERFDRLWLPSSGSAQGKEGLGNAIRRIVNDYVRDVNTKPEIAQEFCGSIRNSMDASREQFLETLSVEEYEEEDRTGESSGLRDDVSKRVGYYKRVHGALKDQIYKTLALEISQNITEQIKPIWEGAVKASTPEAPQGIGAVRMEDIKDFLGKKLRESPLTPLFDEPKSERVNHGFAALFKSIAHAPLEYLFKPDEQRYEKDCTRLVLKARLYKDGLIDENLSRRLKEIFPDQESLNKDFTEIISKDRVLFRALVELFLPQPFDSMARKVLKTAGQNPQKDPVKTKKTNPFEDVSDKKTTPFGDISDKSTSASTEAPKNSSPSPEAVVEELKIRVKMFYFILDAMLFDADFGFTGYYRAFIEEFRDAVAKETNDGGAIKSLAKHFHRDIWSQEAVFQENEKQKLVQQKVAALSSILG